MSKEAVKERQIHASVHGSRIHDKGAKADRDRSVILHSYLAMCDEFRVPKNRRLSTREIATMTNNQLYQASKDLYNGATVKQAQRLAVRLGLAQAPEKFSVLRKALGYIHKLMWLVKTWLRLYSRTNPPVRPMKFVQMSPGLERSDLVLTKSGGANA